MNLNKVPTYTTPAYVILEGNKSGNDCKFSISTPNLKSNVDPVIKDDFHAYLRPFDHLFIKGKFLTGQIHYILINPGRNKPCYVLAAVNTPRAVRAAPGGPRFLRGRLHIYPGWGKGPINRIGQGPDPRPLALHHITAEEKNSGVISIHMKSPGREKILNSSALPRPNKLGVHITTFVIKRPDALDVAGTAFTYVPHPKRGTVNTILREVERVLAPSHIIFNLPEIGDWLPGYHLQVNILLSDGSLVDKDYPLFHLTDPRAFNHGPEIPVQFLSRHTSILLYNNTRLIVTISLFKGEPIRDITLLNKRLDPRRNNNGY